MAPLYPPGTWLNPADSPGGRGPTAAGRFAIPLDGGRFERHFHDGDELWFLIEGKAKMLLEGAEVYIRAGDIVRAPAGVPHDIVEVYEPIRGFFAELAGPDGVASGHRHELESDAAGHDVPARAVPSDFPRDHE